MNVRSVLMAAVCATLLFSPVVSRADHTNTDYNHQIGFGKYHTYSWGKVTVSNELNSDRIKRAVDERLQKEGWELMPTGGKVTVMAKDKIHSEQEAETYYSPMPDGWGDGWGWGGWGWGMDGGFNTGESMSTVHTSRSAHLVVDMFDTKTKKLLWRGVSRGELSDKPEVNRKRLFGDLHDMLKDFPPNKKM